MTKQELVGSNTRLIVTVILTAFASWASYQLHSVMGREFPGDELIPIFVGPIGFAAVFVGLLTVNFLFRSPYDEWHRLDERVAELEQRLTPTVSFTIENEGYPKAFSVGSVTQASSGDYVTNQTGSARFICAQVENTSRTDATSAQVTLTRLRSKSGEPLPAPIVVRWHNSPHVGGYEFLQAESGRAALLFQVTENGVYFVSANKPTIDQATFFSVDDGPYEGRFAVTHGNQGVPLLVDFVLVTGPEPRLTIKDRT